MTRVLTLVALPLVLGLGGCAHHHAMHQGMSHGQGHGSHAATAPAQVNASTPTLPGGYTKVTAPAGAALYFINLKNGDTVSSPVKVQFGLRGMGVAPAGTEKAGTGHHHVLVDLDRFDVNAPLPADERHRHFGAGQTETVLDLKPGPHTLQLVLGDHNHIPHHPPVMSERITIQVK